MMCQQLAAVLVLVSVASWQPRVWWPSTRKKLVEVRGEPDKQQRDQISELQEYMFGLPGELDADLRLLGTNRRRIAQLTSLSILLGVAGDLFGVTSSLLSLPALRGPARSLRLDTYYPVQDFKRYFDEDEKFELLYPRTWLQDKAVFVARNNERAGLRPGDAEALLRRRSVKPSALVAFGPPQGTSRENLSVFKSELTPGFSLRGTLGPPEQAAQRLLDTAIAPPASGKAARLLGAYETPDSAYQFEYELSLPTNITLHNLAVVAERRGRSLYTVTILCPEDVWLDRQVSFRSVADSFRLL